MLSSAQYHEPVARLRTALLADIARIYAASGQGPILFQEPWHIGPPLDDSWPYVAGGLDQQGEMMIVLDTRNGGSYDLEKLHIDDLLWVLDTLDEAIRFQPIGKE